MLALFWMFFNSFDNATKFSWYPTVNPFKAAVHALPWKRRGLCWEEMNSQLPLSWQRPQQHGAAPLLCLFPLLTKRRNRKQAASAWRPAAQVEKPRVPAHTDDVTGSRSRRNEDGDVFRQPGRMRTDSARRVPSTESVEPLPAWTMDPNQVGPSARVVSSSWDLFALVTSIDS